MKTFARLLVVVLLVIGVDAQVLEVKPGRNAIVKEGPAGNAAEIAVLPAGTRVTQLGEAPRYYSIHTSTDVTGWSYMGNFVVVTGASAPVPVTHETLLARADVLRITVIDVEVGDATLIVCPEENGVRDVILTDCGERNDGGRVRNELVQQGFELTGRPITRFYASHYDNDHIGSISAVAPLSQVVYDRGPAGEKAHYRRAMEQHGPDRRTIALSYVETFSGGVNVRCVAVNTRTATFPDASPSSNENANSIALEIDYGAFDYFTAGDLTFLVENRLVNTVRNCDVYHVNHHGSSATSSGLDLVLALDPEVSVVSNGTKYGHPTAAVANRLINDVGSQFFQTNVNPDPRAHQPDAAFIADNTYHTSRSVEDAEGALGNITIVVDLEADRYYVIMQNPPRVVGFPIEH